MDTEYTKGFKAGLVFREEQIIKLLEELIKSRPEDWQLATKGYSFEHLIALIKGEK